MSRHLTSRLADILAATPGGGFDAGLSTAGLPAFEEEFTWPGAPAVSGNLFLDTNTVASVGRIKTVAILVTTAITLAATGFGELMVTGSRTPFATGAVGNTSQLPHNGNDGDVSIFGRNGAISPVQWSGATTVTIATGLYWVLPADTADSVNNPYLQELQWWFPYWGLEFQWTQNPTAGAMRVFGYYAPV